MLPITLVYKLFYPLGAKLFTRNIKIDKDKCTKCGLCEKRCPVKAIKIKDRAIYNKDCMLCQRCMSNCPQDAFWYKNKKYEQYKIKKN